MTHPLRTLVLPLLLLPLLADAAHPSDGDGRPRLLVLTDIGGDPDDQQSMIRLLLHADAFEIEGLIASSSGTPGELKERITRPDLIRDLIDAYGRVHSNLSLHATGFPEPEFLMARIHSGNPNRGRNAVGAGNDTDGSRWIEDRIERADPRPLNISIWGGQTDLAQALWSIRSKQGMEALDRALQRIRVYDIADQDGLFGWMTNEFDFPFYLLNRAADGRDKREAVFRGMYLGGDESLTSREWLTNHVWQDHGPLGALYPRRTWTAPNPHSAMKEGDTPSWFYFLGLGLNHPDHPDWGGWGGRFQSTRPGIWRDAVDRVGDRESGRATVWRWRRTFQNEFAARMDWCVKHPEKANHTPKVVLNGIPGRTVLSESIEPGESKVFSAAGSEDPDGDGLTFHWWIYPEPGRGRPAVSVEPGDGSSCSLRLADARPGDEIHLILEVTDTGKPPLTAYRRAVVTVPPRRNAR